MCETKPDWAGMWKDGIEMNMTKTNIEIIKEKHPCFSNRAHFKYGRIHLPVAPKCNIRCRYCEIKLGCVEGRPGVAEEILTPLKAMETLRNAVKRDYPLRVVAVAGPGEPLANRQTFEVLEMAKEEFPHLIGCVATNGLALYECAELLERIGINAVTVTVNAIDPKVGANIYDYVRVNGKTHFGEEAARILIDRQQRGVKEVVSRGMVVKINTVFIPHVNGDHIVEIAERYATLGANIMNIMPLIPLGRFAGSHPPTCEELTMARRSCENYMEQFKMCKQCRADACCIPGGDDESMGSDCIRI